MTDLRLDVKPKGASKLWVARSQERDVACCLTLLELLLSISGQAEL